jgi:hypothetical protein
VQADRIATLESENASLTSKVCSLIFRTAAALLNALCQVVGMQNAATARATSMQRMQVRDSFLIIVAAASAANSTALYLTPSSFPE